MNKLSLMFIIASDTKEQMYVKLLNKYKVKFKAITHGIGTASSSMLDYFGLNEVERGVIMAIMPTIMSKYILRYMNQRLKIAEPGNGIAFTIPVSSSTKYMNETYKKVLIISTVYEDSDKEKGTVIAQDLPEGTVVSSINKRSITLKISDGLLVPDLVGEDATKALKTLTDKGFKYVETVVSSVADSEEQSNKVSSIVYYPEENANWSDLPHDRRISAAQKVVIYCYGEYTPPTTEQPTTEEPTTEEPTTEKITENEDVIVDNGNNDSENVIIE